MFSEFVALIWICMDQQQLVCSDPADSLNLIGFTLNGRWEVYLPFSMKKRKLL